MQARAFSTNRPHPGITHPARSRLTTTWPLQPGPLATSVGEYCNQPSFVSGGEAEGPWYVGDGQLCSSSRGKSCFFCFSLHHHAKEDRLVLPSTIIISAASIQQATRPPAFRPAVLQSTCRERATPPCAGNRRQPSHLARLLRPIAGTYLFQAFKPCSVTAVESRSVSVLVLCMSSGSLHI